MILLINATTNCMSINERTLPTAAILHHQQNHKYKNYHQSQHCHHRHHYYYDNTCHYGYVIIKTHVIMAVIIKNMSSCHHKTTCHHQSPQM